MEAPARSGPTGRPDLENADERSQLFREALLKGSADGLSRAIAVGVDVNRMLPDSIAGSDAALSGSSPLMLAAYQGKEDQVRLLIDAGADVSYRVSEDPRSGATNPRTAGLTALKVATRRGHTEIADMLKKAGASR